MQKNKSEIIGGALARLQGDLISFKPTLGPPLSGFGSTASEPHGMANSSRSQKQSDTSTSCLAHWFAPQDLHLLVRAIHLVERVQLLIHSDLRHAICLGLCNGMNS